MVRVVGPKDKVLKDKLVVNSTSKSINWSRQLSPFFLGPVSLYDGMTAKNLENAWQYSKVYPKHVDGNGDPSEEYWEWAIKGWEKGYADRYPMGKGKIPLYSVWNDQKLGYVEARKEIYLPLYQNAVAKTEAFQKLKEVYKEHGKLTLFDFDGYDFEKLGMTLAQVLDNPDRKMGHAFVLAMMLIYGEKFKISDLK
jgi:hypothetical protein